MEKRIFGKCSDGRVGEEKSKQNIAFVVYCVSSHPDDKYGKIQIPEEEEEGTEQQSFYGKYDFAGKTCVIAPQSRQNLVFLILVFVAVILFVE